MIPLSAGKKPWQAKARKTLGSTNCHCWDCLRKAGITPGRNSHESHRRDILGNVRNTANGNRT